MHFYLFEYLFSVAFLNAVFCITHSLSPPFTSYDGRDLGALQQPTIPVGRRGPPNGGRGWRLTGSSALCMLGLVSPCRGHRQSGGVSLRPIRQAAGGLATALGPDLLHGWLGA